MKRLVPAFLVLACNGGEQPPTPSSNPPAPPPKAAEVATPDPWNGGIPAVKDWATVELSKFRDDKQPPAFYGTIRVPPTATLAARTETANFDGAKEFVSVIDVQAGTAHVALSNDGEIVGAAENPAEARKSLPEGCIVDEKSVKRYGFTARCATGSEKTFITYRGARTCAPTVASPPAGDFQVALEICESWTPKLDPTSCNATEGLAGTYQLTVAGKPQCKETPKVERISLTVKSAGDKAKGTIDLDGYSLSSATRIIEQLEDGAQICRIHMQAVDRKRVEAGNEPAMLVLRLGDSGQFSGTASFTAQAVEGPKMPDEHPCEDELLVTGSRK